MIYFNADYNSESDKQLVSQLASAQQEVQNYVRSFINALEEDRKSLFFGSLLRSFFLALATAFILWLSIRKKIGNTIVLILIGLLAFFDVMSIDTKYLNSDNYQDEEVFNGSFSPTPADLQILKDTTYYRVFDVRQGLNVALGMQGALPSYFHNSIGGYHPAKLSIYQDLIQHQLSKFPGNLSAINMLNTKYIIQSDQSGQASVYTNPDALGAAWFVNDVRFENSPSAVMQALNNFNPRDTAILFEKDKQLIKNSVGRDSAAFIQLIKNDNDEITYRSNSNSDKFAVFSEIFYNKGWKAFIDDKEAPIVRTNYVLRGLSIPAGQHNIKFIFHPGSYYTGKSISLIAGIMVLLSLLAAAFFTYKKREVNPTVKDKKFSSKNA
jgi:hypothetical protein